MWKKQVPWHGLRHQGISAWVSASCASWGHPCAENRRLNMAENRLGWKQSKRALPVFPENSEIRLRCLTEITFQLPELQIWLNVSVTACLLLFIQAPTKRRQMKELFYSKRSEKRLKYTINLAWKEIGGPLHSLPTLWIYWNVSPLH